MKDHCIPLYDVQVICAKKFTTYTESSSFKIFPVVQAVVMGISYIERRVPGLFSMKERVFRSVGYFTNIV